jgi:hypothetical protein
MMRKMTKKADPEKKKNVTIEMLQPSRYKPSDLNQMAEDTKFTKSKISAGNNLSVFISNLISS